MANDGSINWNELNLVEDEAFAEGTRALRFLIKQIQQAQKNPLIQTTLQSLMRANKYNLVLMAYDRLNQSPSQGGREGVEQQEVWGHNQQANSPQRRISRSPRPPQRPLERNQYFKEEPLPLNPIKYLK